MSGVLVCVKRVVESSAEVVLTEDAQRVDGRYAGFLHLLTEHRPPSRPVRSDEDPGGLK